MTVVMMMMVIVRVTPIGLRALHRFLKLSSPITQKYINNCIHFTDKKNSD